MRDSLWLRPAEHHLMSIRYKRAGGFGVNGGDDGKTGGIWIWEARRAELHRPHADGRDAYADATAGGGRARPGDERAVDATASTLIPIACRSWHTAPLACCATSTTAAAAGAIRSSATPSA